MEKLQFGIMLSLRALVLVFIGMVFNWSLALMNEASDIALIMGGFISVIMVVMFIDRFLDIVRYSTNHFDTFEDKEINKDNEE